MRRRDFIKGISVSTALPLAARAQPREQKRSVAVLMGGLFPDDPGGQAEVAAFETGLTELGWKLGGNIELEYRWPGAELDQISIAANEIVAMRPDLVVSRSTPTKGRGLGGLEWLKGVRGNCPRQHSQECVSFIPTPLF
jgi:putative ABC transport system substrate-binding protein